jgi:hypothetical protein
VTLPERHQVPGERCEPATLELAPRQGRQAQIAVVVVMDPDAVRRPVLHQVVLARLDGERLVVRRPVEARAGRAVLAPTADGFIAGPNHRGLFALVRHLATRRARHGSGFTDTEPAPGGLIRRDVEEM